MVVGEIGFLPPMFFYDVFEVYLNLYKQQKKHLLGLVILWNKLYWITLTILGLGDAPHAYQEGDGPLIFLNKGVEYLDTFMGFIVIL